MIIIKFLFHLIMIFKFIKCLDLKNLKTTEIMLKVCSPKILRDNLGK